MSAQLHSRLRALVRRLRRMAEHRRNRHLTPEQVFSRIYRDGVWGTAGGRFCSGTGSSGEHAERYVAAIGAYIARHSIRRVVDLGCGDFAIGSRIAALGVDYTGVDVVPELVAALRREHGTARVRFAHVDIVAGALPAGDLCLIRQVLQHLSNEQIRRVSAGLRQYPHVLVTEHYPAPGTRVVPNRDKTHGHDTRIEMDSAVYLDEPPFALCVEAPLLEVRTAPLKRDGETLRTFRVLPTAAGTQ